METVCIIDGENNAARVLAVVNAVVADVAGNIPPHDGLHSTW
jgi:hypothetical protein